MHIDESMNLEQESFVDETYNCGTLFHIELDCINLSSHYSLILYQFATALMVARSPAQCQSIALRYIRSSLKFPAVEIVLSDTERDDVGDSYSTERFEPQNLSESQATINVPQSINSRTWVAHILSDKGEAKRKLSQFNSGVFNLALNRQLMVYVADIENDSRVDISSDLHFDSPLPARSMLLVPIRLHSHMQLGLLVLYMNQPITIDKPHKISAELNSLTLNNVSSTNCLATGNYKSADDCINNSAYSNADDGKNDENKCPSKEIIENSSELNVSTPHSFSVLILSSTNNVTNATRELFKMVWEMSCTLGKSLDYSHEWRDLLSSRERADGLLALMQSLYADRLGIQSSVVALTTHAKKLIRAESCTVYIVDKAHHHLWSISSDNGSQVFKPLHSCLPGRCALTGRIISSQESDCEKSSKISDSERQDEYYCSENSDSSEHTLDKEILNSVEKSSEEMLSFAANNLSEVVCMPIMSKDGSRVLAVIEAVNKNDPDLGLEAFTPEDIHLLEIFARIVGPQLELSDFASSCSKETEAGLAFKLNPNLQSKIARRVPPEQCILEEEEDEN